MLIEDIKNEIRKLELSERIILVQDIWDDIVDSNEELPLPEWQKKELDKRLAAYDANPGKTKPWNEVHKELLKKYEKLD